MGPFLRTEIRRRYVSQLRNCRSLARAPSSRLEAGHSIFGKLASKAALLSRQSGLNRMRARPLRKHQQTPQYEDGDNRRGQRSAPGEAAIVYGFVEKIANGRAERPSQDEGRPEQRHP